eukprot:358688-Chlamydomonas_euryale.AAC.6
MSARTWPAQRGLAGNGWMADIEGWLGGQRTADSNRLESGPWLVDGKEWTATDGYIGRLLVDGGQWTAIG